MHSKTPAKMDLEALEPALYHVVEGGGAGSGVLGTTSRM